MPPTAVAGLSDSVATLSTAAWVTPDVSTGPSGRAAKASGVMRGTCASARTKTRESTATVHTTRIEHRSGSGTGRRAPPNRARTLPAPPRTEARRGDRTGSIVQPGTPSIPIWSSPLALERCLRMFTGAPCDHAALTGIRSPACTYAFIVPALDESRRSRERRLKLRLLDRAISKEAARSRMSIRNAARSAAKHTAVVSRTLEARARLRGPECAVLASVAAYVIAYLALNHTFGPIVAAFAIVPVSTVAWLYGWRSGIAAGPLSVPCDLLLALAVGTFPSASSLMAVPGYAVLIGAGAFVGWASGQRSRERAVRLELAEQIADFRALATIGARVGGQALSGTVLSAVVDAVAELVHTPAAAIMLPASNGTELLLVAGTGASTAWIGSKRTADAGVSGRAYRTGQTQIVSDVRTDPDYFAAWPSSGSAISVPILGAKCVLGVLHLECEQRAAFGDRDRRLLEAIAAHVAIVLHTQGMVRDLREADLRVVRTMLAHVPFTVFTIGQDRRTALALSGGLSKVAITRHEIDGLPVSDIIAAAAVTDLDAAFRGETRSGRTKFGGRTLQFHLVPLAESGPIERVVGVAIDTTAEEIALVTQEELGAERTAVMEQIPSGILVVDARGGVISMNAAARGLVGHFPTGALISERVKTLVLRDAASGAVLERTPLTRVMLGEVVPPTDVILRQPDTGEDLAVRVSGRRLADGRVIAVLTDVTEHSQLIRDLAVSEQQHDRISEGLACGAVTGHADGASSGPTSSGQGH